MSEATSQMASEMPVAEEMSLADIDVSRPSLYSNDNWGPYFARLRQEDPVHYCPTSSTGPYWSVTRHEDIKYVDTHHHILPRRHSLGIDHVITVQNWPTFLNYNGLF